MRKGNHMSFLAKSKGEVTYKDLTGFHKWFLIILISMGSSIIYTPMYLKNVFYDPLMKGLVSIIEPYVIEPFIARYGEGTCVLKTLTPKHFYHQKIANVSAFIT